jgi:single-strand DNA-binding protein
MLIGRLGKDPEVRYTQSGQGIASASLATSEKWTDKSGEKQEKTEWHNLVFWGAKAELASKYLHKGSQVFIEGKITTQQWDDDNGTKHYKTEIVVEKIEFLEKSEGNGQKSGGNKGRQSQELEGWRDQISADDCPF